MDILSHFNTSTYIIILIVTLIGFYIYQRGKQSNRPPCKSGWIPYIGCAIEFGKAPLHTIEETRQKLGSVFTIKVAGKRLTFLTDPEDYDHFFNSNKVDFQRAVEQPVKNTANIDADSFFKCHTKIHDTVKGRLAPVMLEPFCKSLCTKFDRELEKLGKNGEKGLNEMVRRTMYVAVLENLFGEGVLPLHPEEEYEKLEKKFVKFDEDFEYGSQLPEMFLGEWSKSKWWLLAVFYDVVAKLKTVRTEPENETLVQTLIRTINGPKAANFSLLMMWASLANAIPITFWTLAYICTNKEIYEEVKREVDEAMKGKPRVGATLTQEEFQKVPSVKRCVLEAIRLRSPGVITRGVAKDMQVKGYTIPKGDLLMLSPFWSHRNTKYFPDPESFKPDRWKNADLDKNIFLDGFVAFGGGRYQCPGRWFALMEMQAMVTLVIHKFDLVAVDPVPQHSVLHLVGTQQPETSMRIQYTARQ